VPWRMFEMLVKKNDGDWHWPDKQWLPLAVSLQARHRLPDREPPARS
jgi:hypothetical protein